MKKTLVFAMAMALGVSATAFAANPFSDVPQGHWAYASVAQLAADGVIDGYPDGTFKGDMTMTRYEMAQIVAKALAKGAINENDALVAEFADELDNLGVRVAKLEAKSDNVKLNGSFRARNLSYDNETAGQNKSDLRTRIGIKGKINSDWTYNALIENVKDLGDADQDSETKFRRAWVSGMMGEVNMKAGRWYEMQGDGYVMADEIDGVKVGASFDDVRATLAYGRRDNDKVTDAHDDDMFIATLGTKFGDVNATAEFYGFADDVKGDIWRLALKAPIGEDFTASAAYIKGDTDDNSDDDGYVLGLNYKKADKKVVGSYDIWARYFNQPKATYVVHYLDVPKFSDGFKGYGLAVDYTIAKNVVASVEYYDTEGIDVDQDDQLLLSYVNFYF